MTSRNVPSRIFRLADSDNDGHLNVEELMNFLIAISKPRYSEPLLFAVFLSSVLHIGGPREYKNLNICVGGGGELDEK